MLDTIKLYSPVFSLKPENNFQQQTTSELATGELIATKTFCNTVAGVNLTIGTDRASGRDTLYLQTSLPKLLYSTSYYEIKESDCERALLSIQDRLAEAGVNIPDNSLADFELSRVDFCRNIEVQHNIIDYLLCLKNFELSRRNKQQFKAETLTFYNKSQELSFYNKVREIKDKETAPEIVEFMKDKRENILRVENRLMKKRTIERELNRKLKVTELFDYKLCKENLLRNLNRLVKPDIQLQFNFESSKRIIEQLRAERARDSFGEFLKIYGLDFFLAGFDYNYELIRKFIVECGYSRRQSYRLVGDLKEKYERFRIIQEDRDLLQELKDKIAG